MCARAFPVELHATFWRNFRGASQGGALAFREEGDPYIQKVFPQPNSDPHPQLPIFTKSVNSCALNRFTRFRVFECLSFLSKENGRQGRSIGFSVVRGGCPKLAVIPIVIHVQWHRDNLSYTTHPPFPCACLLAIIWPSMDG